MIVIVITILTQLTREYNIRASNYHLTHNNDSVVIIQSTAGQEQREITIIVRDGSSLHSRSSRCIASSVHTFSINK